MNMIARAAAACTLAAMTQLAHAAPTAGWTTTDTHNYGKVVTFDQTGAITNNTVVSDQFKLDGLHFSGSIRANGCGYNTWTSYGMQNNSLGTYGPGCEPNMLDDRFAIKFDRTVSKLALDAYHADNSRIATLDLYLKGKLVSNFWMPGLAYDGLAMGASSYQGTRHFANTASDRAGILRIDGALFDEIRFTENWNQHHWGYLFFDNLRFDTVPADVPEPASLGLLALGLAGLGVARRTLNGAARA